MKEKFYLTEEGLKKVKKQCQELKKMRRSKSKDGSPQLFHSEDIDPEYLIFQENINFLEDKISELEHIIKNTELIKPPPKKKQNIVDLGATVLVEDKKKETDEFHIVGPLEADPTLGRISYESPVGKALLGHKTGDEVVIQTAVKSIYRVKRIKYTL